MEMRARVWAVGTVASERAGRTLLERAGVSGQPVEAGNGTWWVVVHEPAHARALDAVIGRPYGVWDVELVNLFGDDAHEVTFRLTEHGVDGTVTVRVEDEIAGEGLMRGGVAAEAAIEYFQERLGEQAELAEKPPREEPAQDRIASAVLRRLVDDGKLELEPGRRWEELRRRAAHVLLQSGSVRRAADSLAEQLIDAGEVAELHASEDELAALLTEAGYRPPL